MLTLNQSYSQIGSQDTRLVSLLKWLIDPTLYILSKSITVASRRHRGTALFFDMLSDVLLQIMPWSRFSKVLYEFLPP